MNDKNQQYLYVLNTKDLIDKKTPAESDLQLFNEWKEFNSKQLKVACTTMKVVFLLLLILTIISMNLALLLPTLLFGLLHHLVAKLFKKSKNYELEYCDYGTIIDKYSDDDKDDKDYYVIVEANNNKLKYKLSSRKYSLYDLGDTVVIFAIKDIATTYMVKKD